MLAIYCRYSKRKGKDKDISVPIQKQKGVEFASQMGWEYEFFVDEAISGTVDEENLFKGRPDFARMLERVRNEEFLAVYCYDQSRIERNVGVWALFTQSLTKSGTEYYENGNLVDLDDPNVQLLTNIMSATNQYFAALTGQKVSDTALLNAEMGKTHGLTAYGYTRGEGGKFEIEEKEAEVVKEIYKQSLNGLGVYRIANKLNERNQPTDHPPKNRTVS